MTSEKRERDEHHQKIRTALAVAGTVFKILWTMLDPRHWF